jgi:threonine/homoserine/homoserine lactone efflux protein
VAVDNLASVFAFAFAASFGAVISPGPVTAAIVTEAPRQGWAAGPLIASGHALLELLMVILINFGLASWMSNPKLKIIIAIGGGILLAGIGSSYLFSAWRGTIKLPEADNRVPARSRLSLISLGILTTISNPFWYTWWITVAASYLSKAQALGSSAIVTFYLGHVFADLTWDTALSIATSSSRRWLSNTHYRFLIILTGGFMLFLGAQYIHGTLIGQ